ncbi:hypothetical protein E4U40_000201 [Claviceps sp. LM458 group G5]|nr:hypothetical protein E4U40_000201 [Claviceps sp. LM458 group G5]
MKLSQAVRPATEEIPVIDSASVPSRRCSGCKRTVSLSDFLLKSTGVRALQCERCTARRVNRKRRFDQLDEQDVDDQDDGPPPARPRQETPAVDLDSVPKQRCSGCKRTLPLSDLPSKNNKILRNCVRCKIDQDNVAPPPVRRARRSRAQINADRAAEERKRMANVEEAMAAAEANARRIREQAEAASADEYARRDAALRESMAATALASQETSRVAVLHESLERRRSLPHSYPARREGTLAFAQLDITQPRESEYSPLGNASEMSLGPSAAAADERIACNPFIEIWGTRRQVLF